MGDIPWDNYPTGFLVFTPWVDECRVPFCTRPLHHGGRHVNERRRMAEFPSYVVPHIDPYKR